MISNELLDEIIFESKNNRIVSQNLIERVILNVINQSDPITKSKFKGIKFVDSDWDFALASCDKSKGMIEVDYNELVKFQKSLKRESYIETNLEIIKYVLHELEHLKEFYKITKPTVEANIIKIGSSDFIYNKFYYIANTKFFSKTNKNKFALEKAHKFYEKYWDIIPTERIAEIDSTKLLIDSINNYPDIYETNPNLYIYLYSKYLSSILLGYEYNELKDCYSIPLLSYLKAIKYNILLDDIGIHTKKIENNSFSISREKRMRLGLPITKEDIYEIRNPKILIKDTK